MELVQLIGFGILILGSLGFLIAAFQTSILWGLGCLLLTPISLIFLILHWNSAKNPFLAQLLGVAVILGGKMAFS